MVWGLFPVDPLPGENEYYIFRKGTYKVGRKGSDIIVNKDKGVSRVHAEIIVDEMICIDHHLQKRQLTSSSKVRIRDCSKYGTFINKNMASMAKVHEFPNKETMLKEGDLVAFGTGNAKYRFSFVPFIFFMSSSKPSKTNQVEVNMSLFGASVTRTWTSKCTHMVVDDFTCISDEIIDAIAAGKPLVTFSWIEVLSGKTICTEIPSSVLHAPTLTLEGVSLKVTDPKSREQCLKGYTFLLVSIQKYKFKEKLQLLLDSAGAKAVCVETCNPFNQDLGENLVCVTPAGLTSSNGSFNRFSSLPKVNEMELISAVITGHLDPSVMASAPVVVTSSCSTDETVVADSDVEMETVASIRTSLAVNLVESAEEECEREIENERQIFQPPNRDTLKSDNSPYKTSVKSVGEYVTSSRTRDEGTRKDKGITSETENLDIIYSQHLIVRDSNRPQPGCSSIGAPIDFKCFRKTNAPSGNSFDNLIPFSQYPYEASDYGNEDVTASVKEEKKRKQMEAIAEDLFKNDKGRRRAASGSLHGLFAPG